MSPDLKHASAGTAASYTGLLTIISKSKGYVRYGVESCFGQVVVCWRRRDGAWWTILETISKGPKLKLVKP